MLPPPLCVAVARWRRGWSLARMAHANMILKLKWGCAGSQGKIKSLEQIYLFSMPVKEYQIVEYFLGSALKDEVMKIMPVQKQTRAGQRTRFKVGGDTRGGEGRGRGWGYGHVGSPRVVIARLSARPILLLQALRFKSLTGLRRGW